MTDKVKNNKTIVAVGMFDGFHRGHQYVLERLCGLACELGLDPAVVTFNNHPLNIINPERAPKSLLSTEKKLDFILHCGVETILLLQFDKSLSKLTAKEFAKVILIDQLNAKAVLIGYDNGFGSDRLRGLTAYRNALESLGLVVFGCDERKAKDGTRISSSSIREAVAGGDMRLASELLGRYYSMTGTVMHGRQLGRTIDFPTANLNVGTEVLIPKPGVYAAFCSYGNVNGIPSMVNIGTNPTVNNGNELHIEVHLITDSADSSSINLYDKELTVEFVERMRAEQRFDSLDDLRAQLTEDRETALRLLQKEKHKS